MGDHDVRDIWQEPDGTYLIRCKCGWRSEPSASALGAVESLGRHRDEIVGAGLPDERRRSPRIDVDLTVEFEHLTDQHKRLEGRTINLSAGGARLDLGETLEQDERGVLVLEAQGRFMALAVVAKAPTAEDRRDRATRVEFAHMSSRVRRTLDEILADLTERS